VPDIAQIARIGAALPTTERLKDLRLLIQKHAPVDSGALRASWSDPRTVQMTPEGRIEIDNPLPYARIQDTGGDIPPYECPPGKVMHAIIDGKDVFFTSRRGFYLQGQHYIREALDEWMSQQAANVKKVLWPNVEGVIKASTIANATLLDKMRAQAVQAMNIAETIGARTEGTILSRLSLEPLVSIPRPPNAPMEATFIDPATYKPVEWVNGYKYRLPNKFAEMIEASGAQVETVHVANTGSTYVEVRNAFGNKITIRVSDHLGMRRWNGQGAIPILENIDLGGGASDSISRKLFAKFLGWDDETIKKTDWTSLRAVMEFLRNNPLK